MRLLISFIALCSILGCIGQTNIESEIITKYVKSEVYGTDRKLLIYLPENFSDSKKYPVSYVLDAESQFVDHKNVIEFLSKNGIIPNMIVVGVHQAFRSSELTHEPDSTSNMKPNGRGNDFEEFLVKEVIPNIDSSYNIAPYRILTGHSLGGLFATQLMLNTSIFNAYVLLDPALWWNNSYTLIDMEKWGAKNKMLTCKTYLAVANSLPSSIEDSVSALSDNTNGTLGFRSVVEFRNQLDALNQEKSLFNSRYYQDESHGTVPFKGTYDAFKFIFSFYKKPSFQSLSDSSHVILEEHFKYVSKELAYEVLPATYDLSGLAWRCQELNKNHDWAFNFLAMYIRLYPNDPQAYIQMGQHYEVIGKKKKSKEFYKRGLELRNQP